MKMETSHALTMSERALRMWLTRDGNHARGCRALTYPDRACSRTCLLTRVALESIKQAWRKED